MADDLIYRPATRKNVGLLIMISGPPGAGKTLSALRLAKGLARGGKIAVADTDNDRALFYADEFEFDHLPMREPFRPAKFEAACVAAQEQGARVWICDNFSYEHSGPGGLLDYHEDELKRLVPDDNYTRREAMNMVGWIKPKAEHKHMLQRLWQTNLHIILCCQAERKTAMQKVMEKGKEKLKIIDLGYQPICGNDIPYAMTMSVMLDVKQPGVPIPIKPLLTGLKGLVDLEHPLDEATGERLAGFAAGEKRPATSTASDEGGKSDTLPGIPPADSKKPKREVSEEEIERGAKELGTLFIHVETRAQYLALMNEHQKRIDWLMQKRRELYAREVEPWILAAFKQTETQPEDAAA